MRFTQKRRAEVLDVLRENPETHVNFDPADYRRDGNILVYADGLPVFLHRWLYVQLIGPLEPSQFLLGPTCDVRGCQNPRHRDISAKSRPSTGRKARVLHGGVPAWKVKAERATCPWGHRYTVDNTYWSTDKAGYKHRTCKQCKLDRKRKKP